MSNGEEIKTIDAQQTATEGDVIHASVGANAQNVAIGKRTVQIIIDKLNLPPWLLYIMAASFVIAITVLLWLAIRLAIGVPVIVQPQQTTAPGPPAQRHCPTTQPCLLLADFDPIGNALADSITGQIRDTLQQPSLITPTTFAIAPSNMITAAFVAQDVVAREGALMLIWGNISTEFEKVIIYFALTDQLGIDDARTIRPYRVHYFDSLTQQISCTGACFADLNRVRTLIDKLSAIIAYTAAGMMHYANDQPEAAVTAFTQALTCAGEPLPSTLPLTTTQPVRVPSGRGFASQAVNSFTAIPCPSQQAALQPIDGLNPAALYYYAGKAQILAGNYRTAIDLLQRAADRNPQDPAAQIAIATAYQSWLDQDDAPQVLAALALAESKTRALRDSLVTSQAPPAELAAVAYELGLITELTDNWAVAASEYITAVNKFGDDNPDAYVSLVALGRVQRLAGNIDAAKTALEKATELDGTAPWAWLELAQVYGSDQPQAKAQVERARQVAPDQAYIDIVEGDRCAAWQDFACAQKAYARALAKRPQSGWLYDKVGEFYQPDEASLPHQSWAKAADYYQQAVKWRPHNPWTQERLAFALFQTGAYAASAEHFALSLAQSHPDTLVAGRFCMLGQAQKEAALLDKAKASLQLCLDGLEDGDQRTLVEGWIAEIEADKQ